MYTLLFFLFKSFYLPFYFSFFILTFTWISIKVCVSLRVHGVLLFRCHNVDSRCFPSIFWVHLSLSLFIYTHLHLYLYFTIRLLCPPKVTRIPPICLKKRWRSRWRCWSWATVRSASRQWYRGKSRKSWSCFCFFFFFSPTSQELSPIKEKQNAQCLALALAVVLSCYAVGTAKGFTQATTRKRLASTFLNGRLLWKARICGWWFGIRLGRKNLQTWQEFTIKVNCCDDATCWRLCKS